VSHIEVRELRQLAQLGRQPLELIDADLEHALASDHGLFDSNSYVDLLELSQLADFSRQRRELVVADLKPRDRDAWSD
jgi:hypothetical protein